MNAKRADCVLCVSVNFHGTSVERRLNPDGPLYGKGGYGRYSANVGNARILNLLASRGIRATWFVPAFEAQQYPDQIEAILDGGHEIASHGEMMEDHSALDSDVAAATLERAHDTLTRMTGRAPMGFRAPHGLLSESTLGHLVRLGYRYDSSFQDDFHPYRLDDDGGPGMIEIPQNEMLIDATLYGVRQTHQRLLKWWSEELDAACEERCLVMLTLHPRSDYGSGRASRIEAVGHFLDLVAVRGIESRTCLELAGSALED